MRATPSGSIGRLCTCMLCECHELVEPEGSLDSGPLDRWDHRSGQGDPRPIGSVTAYLDLADYLFIAEAVTGIDAVVLAKAERLELAESVLGSPQAASRSPGPSVAPQGEAQRQSGRHQDFGPRRLPAV